MKRRDFLKTSAAVASVAAVGAPFVARTQEVDTVKAGHLVGICMSPLFYAKAREYFKDEGLNVQMKFMPNPGDALTALNSGAMDIIHNPFTNAFIAAGQGAPVRIIAGSGAGGLFLVAQKETGIKSMADLAAAKGKGLKIGTVRFNTFELTLYRALVKAGVGYSDYNIVWFNDTLALAAAFESKNLDLATHVEPLATRLIDTLGGVPIASSLDAWGPHGPDCVTNTTARYLDSRPEVIKRYLKAILRADTAIKADLPKAVDVLDAAKFYRVNKETLTAAVPRQMPQVDITKGGEKGMEIAVADMVHLGYLKTPPKIVDTALRKQVLAWANDGSRRDAGARRPSCGAAAAAGSRRFLGDGRPQGVHSLGDRHRDLGDRGGEGRGRPLPFPTAVVIPALRDQKRFPRRLGWRPHAYPLRDRR